MNTGVRFLFKRLKCAQVCLLQSFRKCYSSKADYPSLKPFYLAVHPDFLWQHPLKREVNENSLKELNHFIENLQSNIHPVGPSSLQFYLRKEDADSGHSLVSISLDANSLNNTIQNILSACGLPFEASEDPQQFVLPLNAEEECVWNKCFFYKKLPLLHQETLRKRLLRAQNVDLVKFLSGKRSKAQALLQGIQATKKAVFLQTQEMKERLKLKDIVWDNQWTCLQHRNAIEDLSRLSKQYQSEMEYLTGRKLVFGNETGFYLNGDIGFGCCESRKLWIDLLQEIPAKNQTLLRIWKTEAVLMDQMKGTKVVHQREKPSLSTEKYLFWIEKLSYVFEQSTAISDLQLFPSSDALRILIDSNSDEMKVLNTGEVIVCPHILASDIVAFLNNHSEEAHRYLETLKQETAREMEIQEKCVRNYGLGFAFKDETLQPKDMIRCCEKLIAKQDYLKKFLQNMHICVSSYYIGTEDGVLCIPWNWESSLVK